MGALKTDLFSDEQNLIATIAKALGHPARVAIIEYLLRAEGCICMDIVDEVGLSQPTISQHLRELKDAGLIKGSIRRNAICYCIEKEALLKLQGYLARITNRTTKGGSQKC